jgi:ribonuclease E
MVEKDENTTISGNLVSGSEQGGSAQTGGTTPPLKKRSRLFGSRKNQKKADQAASQPIVAPHGGATQQSTQETVQEPAERAGMAPDATSAENAETPAAGAPTAEAPAAQTAVPEAPATDAPTAEAPAKESAVDAADFVTPAVSIPGLPSTAILFKAPDVAMLPPRTNDDDDADDTPTVRRRSRRRSGESGRGDDPANTVVRVRAPREPELITEPQKVKGSTRLEAKKQRRRDGRDAGRRRPVITEAEFLARRESVDRQMVVRSKNGRIQLAVLEDKVLVEHYVAKSQEASLIGNVYLGRVQNVLPSMEAAFVDIGRGRNAVLYSGEVDWDAAAENSASGGSQARRIELALKPGDKVLVQVTKDPVGHKGARLTSQVSLPGRYLVYVPNGSMNGISRKLPDTERARLKKILKGVLPENVGVIVRTAAEGATEEQLTIDVNRLTAQWADISQKVESVSAPALLHSEPDLLIKIVRDVFNEDFHKLIISGQDAQETIEAYLAQVAPDLLDRVEKYEGERDPFDEYRVTEQIEKALERKVWLPSGGSLIMDRTEAMTVVDVNTGKFGGSGGNLEETVTKNNLEAAEELVRQLRLRDIGGIIVVDFIDMVLESNRDLVLRRLVECLSRDRTKHQVAEVTSLGLVQMTRKKLGLGLLETFSEPCEVCAGRGVVVHHDPVVKHRTGQQPQNERRRGKSGASGGASAGAPVTHAITDDAKNALAQIAASTLAAHTPHLESSDVQQADVQQTDAQQAAEPAVAELSSTELHGRHLAADGTREPDSDAATPQQKVEPVAILDIPLTKAANSKPRVKSKDAEELLEHVLEALPEPKQPGQGRNRNRRVTTAGLTGGVVPQQPNSKASD